MTSGATREPGVDLHSELKSQRDSRFANISEIGIRVFAMIEVDPEGQTFLGVEVVNGAKVKQAVMVIGQMAIELVAVCIDAKQLELARRCAGVEWVPLHR